MNVEDLKSIYCRSSDRELAAALASINESIEATDLERAVIAEASRRFLLAGSSLLGSSALRGPLSAHVPRERIERAAAAITKALGDAQKGIPVVLKFDRRTGEYVPVGKITLPPGQYPARLAPAEFCAAPEDTSTCPPSAPSPARSAKPSGSSKKAKTSKSAPSAARR